MSNEAKIKVDVEGAAEAQRKLKQLTEGFKDWGRTIGGLAAGVAKDLGSASTALARVDPGAAAQKFRDFRKTVTEASVASGRSLDALKSQFADLSNKTLLPDEQVADFSQALGRATYDFNDSRKAVEALRGSGAAAGRSLEEMGGIAETLHNQMGQSLDDIPDALASIEAAAKALGTTGGPAALMDDIQALGGVLSQVSVTGKRSANDLVAVLAALGKGRNVEQAKAIQSALVGRFAAGGEQMRLNLGIKRQDFYDDNGNVRVNAQNVQRLRDFYLKRTGGDVERAKSLASFSGNLGPQLAAALFRPGLIEDMKRAATAKTEAGGSTAGPDALAKLRASQHGIETARQNQRDREQRENLGSKVNAAQQTVADALPDNALLRMGALGIGGGVAGKLTDQLFGALGKGAGSAAASLFQVAEAGGKAQLVFGGGSSGASVPVAGAAAAVGGTVALAAGVYGYAKTEAAVRDASLDAVTSERETAKARSRAGKNTLVNDLAAGRKRFVDHWYGGGYEDVPAPEQAAEAAKYRADPKNQANLPDWARRPVEVRLRIEDASGHPNQVVQVQKGQAGRQ
jgi:hypothetical protein